MNVLTVVVMTYNHRDYISKALDSILSQKVNIDFNILVHDDCSDDGTYEILLHYKHEYPNKFNIVRQKSRKFHIDGFNMMIYKYVVPLIKSKYVAYCDGDDYWCDDLKLQKQLDFMEHHHDYSLCFHNAYQLKRNGDMSSLWFIGDEADLNMSDFVNDKPGIRVATSSIFVKSESFKSFSNWRKSYPVEDVPLYMTAALDGKIHRLPDIMCVYRQFATGSWSSQNQKDSKKRLEHLTNLRNAVQLFDSETKNVFHNLVINQIESCDFRISLLKRDYKTIFLKKNKRFVKQLSKKDRLSLKLQYRFPCLYNLLHKKKKD